MSSLAINIREKVLILKFNVIIICGIFIATLLIFAVPATAENKSTSSDLFAEREIKILNKEMRTADEVELLVVPRGMAFRTRVGMHALEEVGCRYSTNQDPSQREILAEIINIISKDIVSYSKINYSGLDNRIGIRFFKRGKSILAAYGEDYGGKFDVKLNFDNASTIMTRAFPSQMRGLIFSYKLKQLNNISYCSQSLHYR